jgi:chromosome segregation ATPase
MEKMIKIETTDAEANGVNLENLNASDLIKLVYLTAKAEAIIEEMPSIGSSRAKDEAGFRWRYASNKASWIGSCLLQRKAVAIQEIISKIEKLERENPEMFAAQAEKLAELKKERDMIKAEYYSGFAKYDEIQKQNAEIETYDIYLEDLQLDAVQIMELIEKMDKQTKEGFHALYEKLSQKYAVRVKDEAGVPVSAPTGMGE